MKTLEEVFETWEAVIGLEIHAELTTLETKMFCGCKLEFGAAPNTHTCPVSLGLPDALPVPNRAAIESIVLAGLATNCDIEKHSMFYRKNYMYPDMATVSYTHLAGALLLQVALVTKRTPPMHKNRLI